MAPAGIFLQCSMCGWADAGQLSLPWSVCSNAAQLSAPGALKKSFCVICQSMTFLCFYDEFCLHSDDFVTDEGAKASPVNPQQVGVGRAAAIGHWILDAGRIKCNSYLRKLGIDLLKQWQVMQDSRNSWRDIQGSSTARGILEAEKCFFAKTFAHQEMDLWRVFNPKWIETCLKGHFQSFSDIFYNLKHAGALIPL